MDLDLLFLTQLNSQFLLLNVFLISFLFPSFDP